MNLASDYNALAFEPDSEQDPYAKHFIQRAGSRNKNLSVQFDPEKHKYAIFKEFSVRGTCANLLRTEWRPSAGNG
jgi:hypothetical protein